MEPIQEVIQRKRFSVGSCRYYCAAFCFSAIGSRASRQVVQYDKKYTISFPGRLEVSPTPTGVTDDDENSASTPLPHVPLLLHANTSIPSMLESLSKCWQRLCKPERIKTQGGLLIGTLDRATSNERKVSSFLSYLLQ